MRLILGQDLSIWPDGAPPHVGEHENHAVGDGCDLLKLDCEGAEYEILMSMNESVAARVGAVMFEATPSGFNPDEIRAHLERFGFVFEARTFGRNPNHQSPK